MGYNGELESKVGFENIVKKVKKTLFLPLICKKE
ncbi:hypothetical protein V5R22_31720 [Bacillus thuringiensis]